MESPGGNERGIRTVQVLALVACCLGLATACGFGTRIPSYSPAPPPPLPPTLALAVSKADVRFERTPVGKTSGPQVIWVWAPSAPPNETPQFHLRLAPGSQFSAQVSCDVSQPRVVCRITLVFIPRQEGAADERLELSEDGSGQSVWVRLRGMGVQEPPSPR